MSKLPSGYTELEYIESSGKQWINTGFNPKSTTRVKVSAKFLGGAKIGRASCRERVS